MAMQWFGHFDGEPGDEREFLAERWASYNASMVSDGVRNGGDNLRVTTLGNSMIVRVLSGRANIKGYMYELEKDYKNPLDTDFKELSISPSGTKPRIDNVVLELNTDKKVRRIDLKVIKGVENDNPMPQELTRNVDAGGYVLWQLKLAEILIRPNVSVIISSDIKDTRLEPDVCGLMNSVLGVESGGWEAQFQELIKEKSDDFKATAEEVKSLYNELFTRSFTLINNDWDDLSTKKGTTISLLETGAGIDKVYFYTMKLTSTGKTIATKKQTEFLQSDIKFYKDVITFYENSFEINGNLIRTTNDLTTIITNGKTYEAVIT